MSLMLTDIDHFKTFNDNFGHLTGDQVLRLLAMSVKHNVKGEDTTARYGGEEFAVILPNTILSGGCNGCRAHPPGSDGQRINETLDR
jgi:diguanylate cyclase